MCKKLKEISSLNPDKIQLQYGFAPSKRIPMQTLLGQMGIQCSSVDFSPLEQKLKLNSNNRILVLSYSDEDDLKILYSKALSEKSINYALAHELAHCCLHMSPSSKFHIEVMASDDVYSTPLIRKNKLKKECEADHFAVSLLVPKAELRHARSRSERRRISSKYNIPVALSFVSADSKGETEND